jgi:hypothetical protein
LDFWFENKPSGNPAFNHERARAHRRVSSKGQDHYKKNYFKTSSQSPAALGVTLVVEHRPSGRVWLELGPHVQVLDLSVIRETRLFCV